MRVNRMSRARRRAALGLSLAALAAGATTGAGPAAAQPKAAAAPAPNCSAAYRIEQKLSTGTTWRMCWRFNGTSGVVLEDISYQPPGEAKPIKVLNSAKLAQIHVPYDDGDSEFNDVTEYNFGNGLLNMKPAECPGGTIKTVKVREPMYSNSQNVKGLCATTRSRGHAYHLQTEPPNGNIGKTYQAQGKDLLLYTINKVSWYEYITEWRFQDDGTLTMNVGATGSLAPEDYDAGDGRGWPIGKGAKDYADSHSHNVFWRLDFGLDGSSKTRVEQYDSKVSPARGDQGPTNKTTLTKVTKELAGDAKNMRWWRVVSATGKNKDGHARSYELVPGATTKFPGRSFTNHDVYFTEYNKCEQYASGNLGACGAGHPKDVDKWVNGQSLTHPVVWMNVGFHHIVRDEDQQPMPVHWQGFSIAPRDVTAMNPLTPADLKGINGHVGRDS
ncbi:copper amine oxidase [Streptomyces viridochromogenes]|uniref:Amine oxidase n=1 Tax=Streptomyces viridochromogenes TaxID=1938 RepID=A0A0J7ZCQ6_STRVR|nr:copper amine oxidase [Streptomyces viridochromogenes]KMS73192.1 copper amine oxidase [Streptomyces viridochromogenes]KOG07122.1 copper amine oxidase [Streptomyces viridochromogenes]KOG12035.1 copper amine oxidase [Streptomyces viridochromogenes]